MVYSLIKKPIILTVYHFSGVVDMMYKIFYKPFLPVLIFKKVFLLFYNNRKNWILGHYFKSLFISVVVNTKTECISYNFALWIKMLAADFLFFIKLFNNYVFHILKFKISLLFQPQKVSKSSLPTH